MERSGIGQSDQRESHVWPFPCWPCGIDAFLPSPTLPHILCSGVRRRARPGLQPGPFPGFRKNSELFKFFFTSIRKLQTAVKTPHHNISCFQDSPTPFLDRCLSVKLGMPYPPYNSPARVYGSLLMALRLRSALHRVPPNDEPVCHAS